MNSAFSFADKTGILESFEEKRMRFSQCLFNIQLCYCSQPCPDVYWFPIATLRFTKELIGIVETFGQWSDGSNHVS